MFSKIKEYIRQSKNIEQDEEFNNLYKELEKDILDVEASHKESITKVIFLYSIAIIATIILIFIRLNIEFSPLINLLFIITMTIIIFKNLFKYTAEKTAYENKYKSDILIKVIQKINQNEVYFSQERNWNRRISTSRF